MVLHMGPLALCNRVTPMASRKTEINRLADQYGYTLKRNTNHLVWVHAITGFVVTTGKSDSDYRAQRNTEARFRRGAVAA